MAFLAILADFDPFLGPFSEMGRYPLPPDPKNFFFTDAQKNQQIWRKTCYLTYSRAFSSGPYGAGWETPLL